MSLFKNNTLQPKMKDSTAIKEKKKEKRFSIDSAFINTQTLFKNSRIEIQKCQELSS